MKRKHLFISILFASTIIWLILSNNIIGHLWNKFHQVTIENIDFSEIEQNRALTVNAAVDYCYVQNELFDVLSLNGWAYCNNNSSTTNHDSKEISIILRSEKHSYLVHCNTYLRTDTQQPGGFGVDVSLLGLPSGIYRIFIYCSEDGFEYGLYTMNQLISIDSSGINLCDYPSEILDIEMENPITALEMKYSPGITVETDKIKLWGWACLPDTNAINQEIVIYFCDSQGNTEYYSTAQILRDGIADYLGSTDYQMSGFQGTISGENLDQTDWSIRIYLKYNNQWYRSPKIFEYSSDSRDISWVNADDYEPDKLDINISNAKINTHMKYDPGITITNNKISLWGWAFILDQSTQSQEVAIALIDEDNNTHIYSTLPIERSGVADLYQSDKYLMAGFQTSIKQTNIGMSNWEIRILIKQNGLWYQSPHSFVYNAQTQKITWEENNS